MYRLADTTSYTKLSEGDSNDEVYKLQERLEELGYLDTEYDGHWSIFTSDDFLFYGFIGQGLKIGFSHGVFVPPRLICIRIFYHSSDNASIVLM